MSALDCLYFVWAALLLAMIVRDLRAFVRIRRQTARIRAVNGAAVIEACARREISAAHAAALLNGDEDAPPHLRRAA